MSHQSASSGGEGIPLVYICHSGGDSEFAKKLAEDLRNGGIGTWIDAWDMPSGESFTAAMAEGIERSDVVLMVLSDEFTERVDEGVGAVSYEVGLALQKRFRDTSFRLMGIRREQCSAPRRLTDIIGYWRDGTTEDRYRADFPELVRMIVGTGGDLEAASTSDPPQVYICYTMSDQEFARQLAKELHLRGLRVWIDYLSLPPGTELSRAIEKGIKGSDVVLMVLSKAFVTRVGSGEGHVSQEFEMAFQKRTFDASFRVMGMLRETCSPSLRLRGLLGLWLDGTTVESYVEAVERLTSSVLSDPVRG